MVVAKPRHFARLTRDPVKTGYNRAMRIFWRTLAVLGGVVVLLLIAVAIAIRTVDVKEFIGPIQQRVKDATGRDLTVHGGIDFKLGLEPKLVLDDVALGNAPWSKQPQMITAKHVEAQIELLPLLRKRFEVISFKLIEPTIALETDASGKGNWEFPSLSTATTGSDKAPSGATLGSFAVGDIAISDGAVTFRDGKTGEVTTIVVEDLSVHARDALSPVSGRFRGKINDTAVALEGDFGPLDQLVRQRWPYPVTVQGDINGKKGQPEGRLRVEPAYRQDGGGSRRRAAQGHVQIRCTHALALRSEFPGEGGRRGQGGRQVEICFQRRGDRRRGVERLRRGG